MLYLPFYSQICRVFEGLYGIIKRSDPKKEAAMKILYADTNLHFTMENASVQALPASASARSFWRSCSSLSAGRRTPRWAASTALAWG